LKHRLFIALDIPDSLCRDIVRLQTKLDKFSLPVKWEEAEKLHITLNFLGRIDEQKIPGINKIISRTAVLCHPFMLSPVFLETMYKKHEPSFIYLYLTGDLQPLFQLQKSLKKEFDRFRIPLPERFFPHITIGRVKKADPVFTKSVLEKIRDYEFSPLSSFDVNSITLYESLITEKGSHYSRVERFVLK
jgi:2'-5' RNA ligase